MIKFMTRHALDTEDFGPRLIRLRKKHGWTQAELAEKINRTVRAIFYYEREGRYPPAPVVADLAELFHVSIEYLLGREHKSVDSNAPDLLNSPNDKKLWKRFLQLKKLSERDQAAVFRTINAMASAKTG